MAALLRVHERQTAALRPEERYAFPDFGDPAYEDVLVARRSGHAESAVVFHRTCEVFVIAGSPWLLRRLLACRDALAARLRRQNITELHAFVPASAVERMAPWLARFGFRRSNPAFVPFYLEVPDGSRR